MIKEDGTSTIKIEQAGGKLVATDERYSSEKLNVEIRRDELFILTPYEDRELDLCIIKLEDAWTLRDLLNAALHAHAEANLERIRGLQG